MVEVAVANTTRREENDRERESVASVGSTIEAPDGAGGVVLANLGLIGFDRQVPVAAATPTPGASALLSGGAQ